MSIEVINDDDEFRTGYMNIGGKAFVVVGKLPTRGSLRGVAFNSQRHLDAAIAFLTKARKELYGK